MTLTVQSVRSVSFGMLIEQISFGANFMLIGPQENVSLIPLWLKPILTPNHSTEVKFKGYEMTLHVTEHVNGMNQSKH